MSGDDAQLERYLDGDIPSVAELRAHARRRGARRAPSSRCCSVPASPASASTDSADFICELGPSPADRPVTVTAGGQRRRGATPIRTRQPLVQVFKTIADQYVGQISLFKVVSGHARRRHHARRRRRRARDERVHAPVPPRGHRAMTPAGKATAGDLVGVAEAASAATGSHARAEGQAGARRAADAARRQPRRHAVPATQNDDDKLSSALARLVDEDPALEVGPRPDVATHRAARCRRRPRRTSPSPGSQRKFGVNVKTDAVPIEFRGRSRSRSRSRARLKKQSGGHGQFAVVNLRVVAARRAAAASSSSTRSSAGRSRSTTSPPAGSGIEEAMRPAAARRHPGGRRQGRVPRRQDALRRLVRHGVPHGGRRPGFFEAVQQASARRCSSRSRWSRSRCRPSCRATCSATCRHAPRPRRSAATSTVGMQTIRAEVPTVELQRYAIEMRALTGGRGRSDDPARPLRRRARATSRPSCSRSRAK